MGKVFNFESRLLETWIEELIKEEQDYYTKAYEDYKNLNELRKSVTDAYYDAEKLFWRAESDLARKEGRKPDFEKYLEQVWEHLDSLGYHYEKEHFIKTSNNGTTYTINYNGIDIKNHDSAWVTFNKKLYTYNIIQSYFFKVYNMSVYRTMESCLQTANFLEHLFLVIEKNINNYVNALVKKIESKYGKIKTVRDSYMSNVNRVMFECENGYCYLERILAGGYNIQRLHNRLLLKKANKKINQEEVK